MILRCLPHCNFRNPKVATTLSVYLEHLMEVVLVPGRVINRASTESRFLLLARSPLGSGMVWIQVHQTNHHLTIHAIYRALIHIQVTLVRLASQEPHTLRTRLKKSSQAATAKKSSFEDANKTLRRRTINELIHIQIKKLLPEGLLSFQTLQLTRTHLQAYRPTWP